MATRSWWITPAIDLDRPAAVFGPVLNLALARLAAICFWLAIGSLLLQGQIFPLQVARECSCQQPARAMQINTQETA
jgi:hypothetical protein